MLKKTLVTGTKIYSECEDLHRIVIAGKFRITDGRKMTVGGKNPNKGVRFSGGVSV